MSSESLADLCLGLAAVHAVFVTIALVSASLVLQGYVEARIQAEAAANRIVVEVQVLLARLPSAIHQLFQNGVFDEDTLGELARGWTKWSENAEVARLARIRFEETLRSFRDQRKARFDAMVMAHEGASSVAQYAEATRDWEATWLPLRELLATGEFRLWNLRRFETAARRVRSTASLSPLVAMLVAMEVTAAIAARITTFGFGEMPGVNVSVGVVLGFGNAILLLYASYLVVRTVDDLVTDLDRS